MVIRIGPQILPDPYEAQDRDIIRLGPNDEVIERHYGPGSHPGTGTDQQVHAGGYASEIIKYEGSDRKSPIEISRFFAGGMEVLRQDGTRNAVNYNGQDQAAIRQLRLRAKRAGHEFIQTHNHPGGQFEVDYPPSYNDYQFAMRFELDTWHVITPHGKYIVTRPEERKTNDWYDGRDERVLSKRWDEWTADNVADYLPNWLDMGRDARFESLENNRDVSESFIRLQQDRTKAVIQDLWDVEWIPND